MKLNAQKQALDSCCKKKCAPINVVFFTHYSDLYGANRSLLSLLDGLKEYPIIPSVIGPEKGDIAQELEHRDIKFTLMPVKWWVSDRSTESNFLPRFKKALSHQKQAFKRIKTNISSLKHIESQLKQWRADVLYSNSSVLPSGALAAYKIGIPHIWHLREFVDLDYGYTFDLGKRLTQKIINSSHKKIAISKAIQSHFHGGNDDDWSIIYNGIASESQFDVFLTEAKKSSLESNPYTFAIIGKIHPCKGQEIALQALSIVSKDNPNCQLLIVGDGDTSNLKKLAYSLNIEDKVKFWGHIHNPFDAFMAADTILMCSKNEGMGRVTVEAMAACRPVIGFNNAGTSELIEHGKNGLLYNDGPQELAFYMSQLIKNPSWGYEMGCQGWKDAREKYSIENYAKQVFKVINSTQRRH